MVNLEISKEEPVSDVGSTPILFVHGMSHVAWCWPGHFRPYFVRHGYVSHALSLPRPERVKTPILVLGAADDRLFSPSEVEATARAYQTRAELFPDMAHDMMLEAGWQVVADRILGWLSEQGL